MKRNLIILLIVTVSISCGGNKTERPSNLIPESKMVNIIVDLALLNSGAGIDKSILEKEGIEPESHVYKKYDIDSLQFVTSNDYYAHNIDVYQDIYARAKSKLNDKKEAYKKLNEKETKEKKKKDSIARAKRKQNKSKTLKSEASQKIKKTKSLLRKVDSLSLLKPQ